MTLPKVQPEMSDHCTVQAAGVLLVVADGQPPRRPRQFLLMRHTDRWDLPKGHCEAGETLRETALRETEEETGIRASRIHLVDGFTYTLEYPVTYAAPTKQTFTKRVTYFLGRLDDVQKVKCTEHQGFQWFPWDPPHRIQTQTIDPLLAAIDGFLKTHPPAF